MKFKDTTEKWKFLRDNWEKYSNIELADMMETTPLTISQMATIMRRKGIKLANKARLGRKTERSVRWEDIEGGVE